LYSSEGVGMGESSCVGKSRGVLVGCRVVLVEVKVVEMCLVITVKLYNLFFRMQCKMMKEWDFL